MTTQQKAAIKRLAGFFAVLLPALGWALTSAAASVDSRYVHQATYDLHMQRDSIDRDNIIQKLNEMNTRLIQMNCAERVARGCR